MHPHGITVEVSRRDFVKRSTAGIAAVALGGLTAFDGLAEQKRTPVVVFSKLYQELNLGYEDAAALTAAAGLDGVDCPVRPKGEVVPERVEEELPRYAAALREQGLSMPLLTTSITGPATAYAEKLLRTAKRVGVRYYRLGWEMHAKEIPLARQIRELRAQLKELAAMNKEIGLGAIYQNHSAGSRKYLGGDLNELEEIVSGFEPEQVGVAFDMGHALVVHGDQWRAHFEKLRSHVRIVYVKDVKRAGQWVPLGEGDIYQTGFFGKLREIGYAAPVSLHVEHDWNQGQPKRREVMLQTLQRDTQRLRRWLAAA
ncbi:MAG TPA: TIM barrel protein [Clostridia bacterium]|nr:TIM barrel protein [Clostridia bacterium]